MNFAYYFGNKKMIKQTIVMDTRLLKGQNIDFLNLPALICSLKRKIILLMNPHDTKVSQNNIYKHGDPSELKSRLS